MTTISKKESFLKNNSPEEFVQNLLGFINERATEVYIFGSFFLETFDEDSDLDLIIILETDIPFFKRIDLFPELFTYLTKNQIPCDLLIYTPKEIENFKIQYANEPTGFWKDFFQKAKKIR